MTFPTSALLGTDRIGVEMTNKINSHFADASQHGGGGVGISAFVSAESLGINPSNTAAANRAGLNALSNSTAYIHFRAGDYRIDNAADSIPITNFSGVMFFAGGTRLVFSSNAKGGLNFTGGTGFRIYGLNCAYAGSNPVTLDGAQHMVQVRNATDIYFENYRTNGSKAMGLMMEECVRPKVNGAFIKDTRADGLHFSNCLDAQVVNLVCEDTSDDGLAFLNYESNLDYMGGKATNVRILRGGSRGIAVIGQRNVHVSNFHIQNTNGPGLQIAYDEVFTTRVPQNVIVSNGTILDAGKWAGDPFKSRSGQQHGIVVACFTDPTPDPNFSCAINNVEVINPSQEGFSGRFTVGRVSLENVSIRGTTSFGLVSGGGRLETKNLHVEETGLPGVAVLNTNLWELSGVTCRNCCKTDGSRRAVLVENGHRTLSGVTTPTTSRVIGQGLKVVDDQGTPTGYQVNLTANTGFAINAEMGIVNYHFANAIGGAPWAQSNATVGAQRRYSGAQNSSRTSAPSAGADGRFVAGDRVKNTAPAASRPPGWVCVTSGNPGTFKAEANLSA